MILICPITGNVHFDYLVKVVSVSVSMVKLLFFPL